MQLCKVRLDIHLFQSNMSSRSRSFAAQFSPHMPYGRITGISEELIGIRHLDLSWCRKITDVGINYLMQSCKLLETLNISDCDLISSACIEQLLHQQPSLSIIQKSGAVLDLAASRGRYVVGDAKDIDASSGALPPIDK